ncbi:MAG: hypothetical protein LLF75_00245 [Eubacteriales bacterium]|nr:hypothetical protein [Eubacteriales bacterium]
MKNRIRKAILWSLALALLLGSGMSLADSGSEPAGRVHFVLVIDCTGSMDKADAEGMSVSAAELFVDMLPMENATVSVICFGKRWKETYQFQNGDAEEMQPFCSPDGAYNEIFRADNRYISALCELESLGSVTERSELKTAIEKADELLSSDSVTVASSAMLAAVDLLKSAKAEPNNACVVLMSDGRVQVERREAMDAVTALNPYPSYVLELNYDQKNNESSIARKQLTDIAAKYDGDRESNRYIEVKSAGDVIQAVSSVIGRFIDLQAVNPTKVDVIGGETESYEFFVPEMASETNIVVTGEGFQSMEVKAPDGTATTYQNTNTVDPNRTFIRNADKYAVLKIKRPPIGTWSVKIYGESGTNIYIHAVSAKELSLVLRASGYEPETREYWLKNDVVPFTAAFEYEGDIVSSDTFYRKNPAQLFIKNQNTNQLIGPITGEASDSGYSWNIPLQEAGMLDVTAYLPYTEFRDGGKTSNGLCYFVKNLELTLGEGQTMSLPESMHVNEETGPIDVSKLFVNPDCDEVAYSIACKDETGLAGDMTVNSPEIGVVSIRMPSKEGEYEAVLRAKDANMQQPVSVAFAVSVVNQPIRELKKLNLDTIVIHQPKWLGGTSNTKSYDLSEYYIDPDGLPLNYTLEFGKTDDPNVSAELNGEVLTVSAQAKGSEKVKLTITDSSADTREVSLNIKSESWIVVLVKQNLQWILLALITLILLLVLLDIRRVKGAWRIGISGPGEDEKISERFSTLTTQRPLRKPKITLLSVLRCAEQMNDDETRSLPDLGYVDQKYPMLYGRLAGSKVTIKGLDYAHSHADVLLGDDKLSRKRSRIVLRPGQCLEFRYSNGMDDVILTVTLKLE